MPLKTAYGEFFTCCKLMFSDASRSNFDQLLAESALTPLMPRQRLSARTIATRVATAVKNEKSDAPKDRASEQVRSEHAPGVSERSDLHHQRTLGTPARASNHDLSPAQAGTSAGVSRRQQLAFQPRGVRTV